MTFILHMSLHVQCQMVRSGEGPLAEVTLERPMTSVFSVMTSQLVGPGELPATTLPVTVVWFLACMCSHMSLQVRTLGVRLSTARELAAVRRGAFSRPGSTPSLWLAVIGREELQKRRRRRGQHHARHARVGNSHRFPEHPVLSMILLGTLGTLVVGVLGRVRRISHELSLMCYVRVMVRVHRGQMTVFAHHSLLGRILLHAVVREPLKRRLVVQVRVMHSARGFLFVHLFHEIIGHHARLF